MSDKDKGQVSAEEKARAAREAREKAKAKAAAAAKAKAKAAAAAKAKREREKQASEGATESAGAESAAEDDEAKAKAKAAAAAKAKAKAKAAAAAKAKREREKQASEGATESAGAESAAEDDEAKAKAKAAAIAKAKAAAAARKKRAQAGEEQKEEQPKEPSQNQPLLDKYVRVISEELGEGVIEEQYINELSKEWPTLVIQNDRWFETAQLLQKHEQLAFDFLSGLHGIDHEKYMEVYYDLYSFANHQSLAVKVKTDRDDSEVASVAPIWLGADWPERETYDLLGIRFTGHPNLKRIMLTDDWVGHPLRKDYEQYDEEV